MDDMLSDILSCFFDKYKLIHVYDMCKWFWYQLNPILILFEKLYVEENGIVGSRR